MHSIPSKILEDEIKIFSPTVAALIFVIHFYLQFGRGVKRELKSATATTAEMHGKLSLRIVQGGAATLHAIRVLQPKQVSTY